MKRFDQFILEINASNRLSLYTNPTISNKEIKKIGVISFNDCLNNINGHIPFENFTMNPNGAMILINGFNSDVTRSVTPHKRESIYIIHVTIFRYSEQGELLINGKVSYDDYGTRLKNVYGLNKLAPYFQLNYNDSFLNSREGYATKNINEFISWLKLDFIQLYLNNKNNLPKI